MFHDATVNFKKCLVLLMLAVVHLTDSHDANCHTPQGLVGKCTIVPKCSYFQSLTKNGITSQVKYQLQKSFCGLEGSHSKFCCPMQTSAHQTALKAKPAKKPAFDKRLLLPEKCGIDRSNRIVGGKLLNLDEFPWLALLEYNSPKGNANLCGGVLISKRYVLTAAHCLKMSSDWKLNRVRLGEHNVRTNPDCLPNGDGTRVCANPVLLVPIERQIVHEHYDAGGRPGKYGNDIAMLRLSHEVHFTNYVQPICLPATPELGQIYYAAGWGQTGGFHPLSDVKLKVSLPRADFQACSKLYASKQIFLGDSQMCAGGRGGKDTCKGDSGGPLMRQVNIGWVVDGVVSFGKSPCGLPGWPAIYTKVHNYVPWIIKNLQP